MNLVYVVLVMDYLEIVLPLLAIVKMDTLKWRLMKIHIVNSAVINVLRVHLNQFVVHAPPLPIEIPPTIVFAIITIKKLSVKPVKLVM
jgi:hypothetical protein